MTFLDQTGLERLWLHIVGRLNGFVQSTRTINGKALNNDIVLTAVDVGADDRGAAAEALSTAKSYTNTEIDAAVVIKADASDLLSHTDNTAIHITSEERTNWNYAVVNAVPSCSSSHNGQFLRVVNGVAAWDTVPNAEEASF